jgi:hypothetical protein
MAQTLTATEIGSGPTKENRQLEQIVLSEVLVDDTSGGVGRIYDELSNSVDKKQWFQFKSLTRDLIKLSSTSNEDGDKSVLQQVLLYDGDEGTCTPLLVAVCRQSAPLDVVRMIVNSPDTASFQEFMVFKTDKKTGRTALHEAVVHGASVAVLKCLLDAAHNVLAAQLGVFMEKLQHVAAEEKDKNGEKKEGKGSTSSPSSRRSSASSGTNPSCVFPSLLELDLDSHSPLHDALTHNCGLEMIDMLIQYDEKLQQYNRRSTLPAVLQTNADHAVPLYLACEQAVGKAGASSLNATPVLKHLILCTYRSHMLRKQAGRVSPFSLALSTSGSTLLRAALETCVYMGQYAHKVLRLVAEHVPDQLWQWYKPEDGGQKKMLLDWVNTVMSEPVASPIDAMRKMSIQDKNYKALKTVGDDGQPGKTVDTESIAEDRPKKRK